MEQERLFDDKPYIRHHFQLPENVIPLPLPLVESTGHDNFADNLKCDNEEADTVRAKVFNLPRRLPPEDIVA